MGHPLPRPRPRDDLRRRPARGRCAGPSTATGPTRVAIVGYARPESMAMLDWARRNGRPAILMSESQAIDHPRVWWKEAIKRRRVRRFSTRRWSAGRRHRDYLVDARHARATGSPWATTPSTTRRSPRAADGCRRDPDGRDGPARASLLPRRQPVRPREEPGRGWSEAFARYRARRRTGRSAWDLVLCGDGPAAGEVEAAVAASGLAGVDPPAGLPPGRRAAALVRVRLGVRASRA